MSTSPRTIGIIDDDHDVCESLEALIYTLGYECATFHSAEALLSSHRTAQLTCLIVDFDLPMMNGADLLHELRHTGINTPAVLYTGQAHEFKNHRLKLLHGIRVLQKGNQTRQIVDQIQLLLNDT